MQSKHATCHCLLYKGKLGGYTLPLTHRCLYMHRCSEKKGWTRVASRRETEVSGGISFLPSAIYMLPLTIILYTSPIITTYSDDHLVYTLTEIFLQTCISLVLLNVFDHFPKQEKHFTLQPSCSLFFILVCPPSPTPLPHTHLNNGQKTLNCFHGP